jgi:hypothetical protein
MSFTDGFRPPAREPTPEEVGVRGGSKACGGCTLCCKVLGIGPNGKAPGVLCPHAAPGSGCGVHDHRPEVCATYQCAWTWAEPLDPSWRPDRAGFLINPRPDPAEVEVVVDPDQPDAWRREPYASQIKRWSDPRTVSIARVLVRTNGRVMVLFPETEIDLGLPNQPNFRVESGYEMRDGRMQPFARFTSLFGATPSFSLTGPRP